MILRRDASAIYCQIIETQTILFTFLQISIQSNGPIMHGSRYYCSTSIKLRGNCFIHLSGPLNKWVRIIYYLHPRRNSTPLWVQLSTSFNVSLDSVNAWFHLRQEKTINGAIVMFKFALMLNCENKNEHCRKVCNKDVHCGSASKCGH